MRANHLPPPALTPQQTKERAMKPTITWIVIADGDQARIFSNDGPGKGLRAMPGAGAAQDHLRATDIMADRPGRASNPGGPGARSAVGYRTDPVAARERRFVENLADMLEEKHVEGAFDRLVIAAAPAALGDLRPALSDAVRNAVLAELPKDLTNIPTAQLAGHLDGVIAL